MKILSKILLIFFLWQFGAVAQNYRIDEGFYTGFDPTKIDENKFEIDASVDKKERPVEGKYYGYKFGNGGFFIAPEAMRNLDLGDNLQNPIASQNSISALAQEEINYNIKANIGYEFSDRFKSFVIYDVGNFSLSSANKSAKFQAQNVSLGLGSQIEISDGLVIKLTYSQQQLNDATLNQQNRLKADVLRFGTFINF
jgi:hypothetical protein